MKKMYLLLMMAFCMAGFSQKSTDTIRSKKLGIEREIYISLPPSYKQDTKRTYPLLVLLDGNYLFDPVMGTLNYANYWDDLPEIILVGIDQRNQRDSDCETSPATGLPENVGSDFFEYIGEVVATVQKSYRVGSFKIIAGHDLTAGFANLYLYKDQPLFNGYISMSAELPANMEENIPKRLAVLKKPIFYYHAAAEGDLPDMKDRILLFDEAASKISDPGLHYFFDNFKGKSHYSMVMSAIPNALYSFFAAYAPITTTEYNEKIAPLSSGYVDYLIEKYKVMQSALNMEVTIRQSDFRAIEAAILKNKAYEELDKLADLAKKNYPKTMLADYQRGMMYEKMGNYKKAASAYMSANQKDEIGPLTKNMMMDKVEAMKNMK
ncbi:alpha/beta hydrolase [Flavobacterium ardleyense]|uniref:alpha/beta hydrolase n=1 Tax=Flavobacterium ardleyense TaxID=2038737 RepID=UPI00298C1308|nr:alpha/beta hydrolase-fold protein [Flavobacterium ardleyense]